MIGVNVIFIAGYLMFAPVLGGLLTGTQKPFVDVFKLLQSELGACRLTDFFAVSFFVCAAAAGCLFFAGESLLLVIFVFILSKVFLTVGLYLADFQTAEKELLLSFVCLPILLMAATGFYLHTGSLVITGIAAYEQSSFIPLLLIFAVYVFILAIKLKKSQIDIPELSGRSKIFIEIGYWYENVYLFGLVFLFFANGAVWWSAIGAGVCGAMLFLMLFGAAIIGQDLAKVKWRSIVGASWISAAAAGYINILFLYTPGIINEVSILLMK